MSSTADSHAYTTAFNAYITAKQGTEYASRKAHKARWKYATTYLRPGQATEENDRLRRVYRDACEELKTKHDTLSGAAERLRRIVLDEIIATDRITAPFVGGVL